MKKFLVVLIIIFICGIISADLCLEQMEDSDVLIEKEFYERYSEAELAFKDVFWSILYERIKLMGMLLLLCFTPIKAHLMKILLPVFGFSWGFFLMSCIKKLGIAGVFVGLASVLPHGIFYGAGVGLLLSRKRERSLHFKKQLVVNIGAYVFIILFFLTACIIESLVGVHFIPWIIRLSMI